MAAAPTPSISKHHILKNLDHEALGGMECECCTTDQQVSIEVQKDIGITN